MGEKKGVLIDPKQLMVAKVERVEEEVEVPELNKLMGLDDGQMAIIKIRQLDLDEHLSCQMDADDRVTNVVEGAIAAAASRGEFEEELLSIYKELSPKTQFYIDLCQKGVLEPKLTRNNWVFLCKNYPLIVERIAARIVLLTRGGSDVKKNS